MERYSGPRPGSRYDNSPVRPVTVTPLSSGHQRALSQSLNPRMIQPQPLVFSSPNRLPPPWPYLRHFMSSQQPIMEETYSSNAGQVTTQCGSNEPRPFFAPLGCEVTAPSGVSECPNSGGCRCEAAMSSATAMDCRKHLNIQHYSFVPFDLNSFQQERNFYLERRIIRGDNIRRTLKRLKADEEKIKEDSLTKEIE